MTLLGELISKREKAVDSAVAAGLGSIAVMHGIKLFDVWWNHAAYDISGAGIGTAAVIAAFTAAKGYRDRYRGPDDVPVQPPVA